MKKLAFITIISLFASSSFARTKGTVTVYGLQAEPQVKVILIEGEAAQELYNSYDDSNISVLEHGANQKTVQKNGKNVSCMQTTIFAKNANSKDKNNFSCEITVKMGEALPAARG